MLEALPRRVGVDPVADPLVVGQPELAEGRHRAERRGLRAEVGAAEEDRVDGVADGRVNLRQVLDPDLGLPLEDPVDVIAPALQATCTTR